MESLSEKKTVVMPEGMIVIHNKLISLMMTLFSHFFLTSVRADRRLKISYILDFVCFLLLNIYSLTNDKRVVVQLIDIS